MKDPCLECLVQVTCWQICDDKKNYATLLSNAMNNYRGQTRFNKTYQKQFKCEFDVKLYENIKKLENPVIFKKFKYWC